MGNNHRTLYVALPFVFRSFMFFGGGWSIPNKMSANLKFIHYIYKKQI